MNEKISIDIFKYSFKSKLKAGILFILFSLGVFFSLNFFAISNQPDFFSTFDPSLKEKTILIVDIIFPISVISLIVAGLYLYEFFCMVRLEDNKLLVKQMPFCKRVTIDIDNIIDIKSYKFLLVSIIKDTQKNKIFFFPSIEKYNLLMNKIIDMVNNKETETKKKTYVNESDSVIVEPETFITDTPDNSEESDKLE